MLPFGFCVHLRCAPADGIVPAKNTPSGFAQLHEYPELMPWLHRYETQDSMNMFISFRSWCGDIPHKRVLCLNRDLHIRARGKQPSWHQDNSTHPQTRDYLSETETWHFICRENVLLSVCLSVRRFLSWKDLQTQAPSCLRGVINATSWLTATVWSKCTVRDNLLPSFVLISSCISSSRE